MRLFKVKLNGKFRNIRLKNGMRILDVMHQLGANREIHLAKKNGRLVSELEEAGSKDRIEIFGVVYGG